MLDDRTVCPMLGRLVPKPVKSFGRSDSLSWVYIMDDGRELLGVPLGVPFGVDEALSALAFLELDRGVMLELKKALTGVSMACLLSLVRLPPFCVPFCTGEDTQGTVESTFFGSNEILPARCDGFEDAKERLLPAGFCFWFIGGSGSLAEVFEYMASRLRSRWLAALNARAFSSWRGKRR